MLINLGSFQQKDSLVFSGRPNGESVRKELELDKYDKTDVTFEIIIPEDTLSVNTSFFLGLFGDSVRAMGKDIFKKRFQFKGEKVILDSMESDIDEALKKSNVLG